MDATGIRTIKNGQDWFPAIDLEIDIMTFLAILRSTIAEFHLNSPVAMPIVALSAAEADAITGGMPAPDPSQNSDQGNEGDEADEDNEDDEGDENNEGDEGDEVALTDEGNEGKIGRAHV